MPSGTDKSNRGSDRKESCNHRPPEPEIRVSGLPTRLRAAEGEEGEDEPDGAYNKTEDPGHSIEKLQVKRTVLRLSAAGLRIMYFQGVGRQPAAP